MNLCQLCASIGRTCCQDTDILVTDGDLRRIAQIVGNRDFVQLRPPLDPLDLGGTDDPDWVRYTLRADGRRQMLRLQPGGDCFFLGPGGCRLTLDTRPLVCRLYPLQYTEAGFSGVGSGCPGHLLPPDTALLHCMESDTTANAGWLRQLYRELRDDYLRRIPILPSSTGLQLRP